MTSSEEHFDRIAKEYEYWKGKNQYYYDNLKGLLQSLIPAQARVLEIGCGTGDLLSSVIPREGVGIDISSEMIAFAERRYAGRPELSFERVDLLASEHALPGEYLFMSDVLEHVKELPLFLERVAKGMEPGATLVVTLANPLWEPLLMLTEKLGMKMPEGPHWRLPISTNEALFRKASLTLREKGYRLLIPKKLPGSDWLNRRFYTHRLLAPLGFIVYWVLVKEVSR